MLTPLTTDDPRRIGPYRLANRIGAGGMGTVYLGFADDGKPVAVKVPSAGLADDPEFRSRFRQEVDAARRVHGDTVAAVLDADLTGDRPWMATEFVEGKSLADAVASRGRLDDRLVQGLAVGLADALVAIHAAGVVHRDLKPSNVLMAWDGPKVIDFGIARASDNTSHTRTGMLIGTLVWMAPEQLRGERAGPPADIFAWGACVAFAAAGRPPFRGERAEAVGMQILTAEPDLNDVPAALVSVVRAALDKEPARRPRATDLLAQLVGHDVHSRAESDQAAETALARYWTLPPTPPEGAGPPGGYDEATARAPSGPGRGAPDRYGTGPGYTEDRFRSDGYGPDRGYRTPPPGAESWGAGAPGTRPTRGGGGTNRTTVLAVAALLVVLLGGGAAAAVVLTHGNGSGADATPTLGVTDTTGPTAPSSSTVSSSPGQSGGSGSSSSPSSSPSPTTSPTPSPAPTTAAPMSSADAAALIRSKGYEPNMSTYSEVRSLSAVIGTGQAQGDTPQQFAFVFADGQYRGTDTKAASANITILSQPSEREIVLRYGTYTPQDPATAPSGHADVRFTWDGKAFTALDPIPSNDPNAPISRR